MVWYYSMSSLAVMGNNALKVSSRPFSSSFPLLPFSEPHFGQFGLVSHHVFTHSLQPIKDWQQELATGFSMGPVQNTKHAISIWKCCPWFLLCVTEPCLPDDSLRPLVAHITVWGCQKCHHLQHLFLSLRLVLQNKIKVVLQNEIKPMSFQWKTLWLKAKFNLIIDINAQLILMWTIINSILHTYANIPLHTPHASASVISPWCVLVPLAEICQHALGGLESLWSSRPMTVCATPARPFSPWSHLAGVPYGHDWLFAWKCWQNI